MGRSVRSDRYLEKSVALLTRFVGERASQTEDRHENLAAVFIFRWKPFIDARNSNEKTVLVREATKYWVRSPRDDKLIS
jgi:hypothetical protein